VYTLLMIVDIEKLTVDYAGIKALEDVSFGIAEGDFLGIIGPNGAGKSTLIRHLNRLIDPTDGEIIVDGTNVMQLTEKKLYEFRKH